MVFRPIGITGQVLIVSLNCNDNVTNRMFVILVLHLRIQCKTLTATPALEK